LAAAFTLFALYQSFQWPRYSIASGSMDPTLEIGDAIAAHAFGRDHAPQRGDPSFSAIAIDRSTM
jgi:signal peptidase I